MLTVSLTQARARLGELVDKAERGERIIITRHGWPVAQVTALHRPGRPVPCLAAFRAGMPGWGGPSVDILRDLRNDAF